MLDYLLNKLSIERTKFDIAIRNGGLDKQQYHNLRIELLKELVEGISKLKK